MLSQFIEVIESIESRWFLDGVDWVSLVFRVIAKILRDSMIIIRVNFLSAKIGENEGECLQRNYGKY